MKYLVLGVTGMAGHTIALYLVERGHDVIGFSRKKTNICNSITGDIKDVQLLEQIINSGNFDAIINCVGILNKDAEYKKSDAVFINAYIPHLLVKMTNNMKTQVIHLSTDCVFSGKSGDYTENDFRDGETFYDRTKALGEIEDTKNLTLRNSIVGPDTNSEGIGLLNWFMKEENKVNGYSSVMWTGQTTLQLAKTIEIASKQKVYGLYNMVPQEKISKYDLLKLFKKYLRNDEIDIIPINSITSDKSLKRTKYEFDYIVPDYEKMIMELSDWIYSHIDLYPHYKLKDIDK